ncbi:MAG: hypothetical protein ACKO38_01070 [Planctomycetota bacterium]
MACAARESTARESPARESTANSPIGPTSIANALYGSQTDATLGEVSGGATLTRVGGLESNRWNRAN